MAATNSWRCIPLAMSHSEPAVPPVAASEVSRSAVVMSWRYEFG
jgi:hypothetical protein